MDKPGRFGRRLWVPAGVLIVTGAVLAGTLIASAAAPALPKRTAAQLLVDVRQATLPSAMTAVVTESANLGFPALPNIAGLSSSTLSAASLITGTHTADIWYAGPQHVRIALPVSFGETDLRINGNQVWLWDSKTQTATRLLAPALVRPPVLRSGFRVNVRPVTGKQTVKVRPAAARPARNPKPASAPPVSAMTPLQAAKMALAEVGPTTKVTVAGTAVVAGRSAYQLTIAPRSDQSLIDRVVISIDAVTHLPLQVQIFARGVSGPAFQIGFTSLTLGRPAMSNFAFIPPHGAKVKTARLPSVLPGFLPGPVGWPGRAGVMPGGVTRSIVVPRGVKVGGAKGRHVQMRVLPVPIGAPAGPQVLGSGWLAVAVLPNAGSLLTLAGPTSGHRSAGIFTSPPSHSAAYSSTLTVRLPGAAGGELALLSVLLRAASPVHASWGSGRLLRTSLFSVLITSKGQVLVGAVTPAVLYADAAKAK
jgi:outer membrane lipoprotein-sorting protein